MSDFTYRKLTLKDFEELVESLEKEAQKPPTPPDMFMAPNMIQGFHDEGVLEFILKEYNVIVGFDGHDKLVELGYLKLKDNESRDNKS